jgi:hypothetical protein
VEHSHETRLPLRPLAVPHLRRHLHPRRHHLGARPLSDGRLAVVEILLTVAAIAIVFTILGKVFDGRH